MWNLRWHSECFWKERFVGLVIFFKSGFSDRNFNRYIITGPFPLIYSQLHLVDIRGGVLNRGQLGNTGEWFGFDGWGCLGLTLQVHVLIQRGDVWWFRSLEE